MGLKRRSPSCLVISFAACAPFSVGPERVPPAYLGCFSLEPRELRREFTDSLTRPIPEYVRLNEAEVSARVVTASGFKALQVLPADPEYPRFWTQLDRLPSTYAARHEEASFLPRISGDSVDVYFTGPIGNLVLRVGVHPDGHLRGRAEWVNLQQYPAMALAYEVRLGRVPCHQGDVILSGGTPARD